VHVSPKTSIDDLKEMATTLHQPLTSSLSVSLTHFEELRDILAEKQTLSNLTAEFKEGKYTSFNVKALERLIKALFEDSPKRQTFIDLINSRI
jgi:hypothetical protein